MAILTSTKNDDEPIFGAIPGVVKLGLCAFFSLAIIVIVPVLIATSLERVSATEVALAYDTVNKKLGSEILTDGLQRKPTFGELIKWPTTYQTIENADMSCNTADGVVLVCDVNFQYFVRSQNIYNLTTTFKNFNDYRKILRSRSRSAIRHACARYTARQFQTIRSEVSSAMANELAAYLNGMSASVMELQLVDVDRPNSYEQAVQSKEAAVADIELAKNQKQQRLTTANTRFLVAQQEANRTMDNAYTQAKINLARAQANTDAITAQYQSIAGIYGAIKSSQNLTVAGILSYMGSRLIAETTKDLNARLEAPAVFGWKDRL